MNPEENRYDAVVIGAGFAGITSARDLTEQGNRVLLLEARDRLGGRTWTKKFPGTDMNVEMGGQFIMPGSNPAVEREMARYGVETVYVAEPGEYPTILNGKRNPGPFPVPIEQLLDFEKALVHCVLASSRITQGIPLDHQGVEDLDIPMADFLAPLDLPVETREFVETVANLVSFRPAEEVSALQFLNMMSCFGNSPLGLYGALGAYLETGLLLERMTADITEVRLNTPVARVDQSGADVLVTTAHGETITASAVVVATPMNTWNDIEFLPQLSETKRVTSDERHGADRSGKAMLRLRKLPVVPLVVGSPKTTGGAFMLASEGEFDNGDPLMAMFGMLSLDTDEWNLDYDSRESVDAALQSLLPGAELVEYDAHNFNADPYSKGDWVSWKPGRVTKSHSALGAAEGRIAFATADVAPKWLMTIEGAVECGHKAAHQTLNQLVRLRESSLVRPL
ncbi:flavin monoamine oxidase family protein [Pseudonocardia endophytica]|uniref:Monoamine oxidase n=1 Tax=Pseudonocardia endophytica TaxID=401976 RepID=A0A4R1HNI3_PSEEN|nr:NAD(P)/FAD-dependent oxidoreductase [Pseudonocardia endophytica]TCK21930.1 monoamine oxidase [Pseudonocardia endophytica]